MTLSFALNQIGAPKGMTSIVDGLMSGDLSVLPHNNGKNSDLKTAAENVAKYEKDLKECKSDWSYWSILGDLEYWRAIHNILQAAEITGNDNLPDVIYEKKSRVVMDEIYEVQQYGEKILSLANQSIIKQNEKQK